MAEATFVIMRWLHLASVAGLIGGMLYGQVVAPPEQLFSAGRYRPVWWTAMSALIVSGIYAILSSPGHSARYHMLLGIKLLLAAHVFAVAAIVSRGKSPRAGRLMTGAALSGLAIIAIAGYLRRIF